jgi:hypothetical protein
MYLEPFSVIPTHQPIKKPVKPPEPEARPIETLPVAAKKSEAEVLSDSLAKMSRLYGGDWQTAFNGVGLNYPRLTPHKPAIVIGTPKPATDRNLVRELLAIAQKGDMHVVYEASKNGFDITQIERYQEKSSDRGRREITERWGQLITDPAYASWKFEEKLVGMLDVYYTLAPMPEQGDDLPTPERNPKKDDYEPPMP